MEVALDGLTAVGADWGKTPEPYAKQYGMASNSHGINRRTSLNSVLISMCWLYPNVGLGSSANREILISESSQSAGVLLTDEAVVDFVDDAELLGTKEEYEGFEEAEFAACSPICCPWVSEESLEDWVVRVRLIETVAWNGMR